MGKQQTDIWKWKIKIWILTLFSQISIQAWRRTRIVLEYHRWQETYRSGLKTVEMKDARKFICSWHSEQVLSRSHLVNFRCKTLTRFKQDNNLLTIFAQNYMKSGRNTPRWCEKNPLQRLIKCCAKMRNCYSAISFTIILLQSLFFVCDNLSDSVYRQLRSVIQKFFFGEANLNLGRIFSLTISLVRGSLFTEL